MADAPRATLSLMDEDGVFLEIDLTLMEPDEIGDEPVNIRNKGNQEELIKFLRERMEERYEGAEPQ